MNEIISIHVGQGGIQLGNTSWQLFCLQHGIQPNGQKILTQKIQEEDSNKFNNFFLETKAGKYIPRNIYVDLDSEVIDQVRKGKYSQLYESQQLISDKQDAGNNYARGHNTLGNTIIDLLMERIGKVADQCSNLQGFMLYHSSAGGTGSGLGSLLMERLETQYQKKLRINNVIYPHAYKETNIMEPYNTMLTNNSLLEHSNGALVFDNQALRGICQRQLGIDQPSYQNMNAIAAQTISAMTASMRMEGCLNANLKQFQQNLVPYPRIPFLLTSFSPFIKESISWYETLSHYEITNACFQPGAINVKCDPRYGRFMACSLAYRGDWVPKNISAAFAKLKTKRTIQFVDWNPCGFKLGINYQKPIYSPYLGEETHHSRKTCCMVANSTALGNYFGMQGHRFDLMFQKRAFVHWYVKQGLQQKELSLARQNLAALQKDYQQASAEVNQQQELQ